MPQSEIILIDGTESAVAGLEAGAARFIAALAFEIEARAKPAVQVHTGALQASICAVTAGESHYAANVAAAATLNPKARFAPEVVLSGPLEAAVQVPISYASEVEFGTVTRPGHPAVVAAVESAVADAAAIAREAFGR